MGPLYAPFKKCSTSVFAEHFLQKLILLYQWMQLGPQQQGWYLLSILTLCTCLQSGCFSSKKAVDVLSTSTVNFCQHLKCSCWWAVSITVHWRNTRKYGIYNKRVHISKPIEHVTCNSSDLKWTFWRRIAGIFVCLYSWGRLTFLPPVSLWLW